MRLTGALAAAQMEPPHTWQVNLILVREILRNTFLKSKSNGFRMIYSKNYCMRIVVSRTVPYLEISPCPLIVAHSQVNGDRVAALETIMNLLIGSYMCYTENFTE